MSNHNEPDIRQRIARIETLIKEIEQWRDPQTRVRAQELVQAILEYHGAGVSRIIEQIQQEPEAGPRILSALADDDLAGSLLLLYGVHPLSVEERVRRAVDKVRSSPQAHGGDVELIEVQDSIARLYIRAGGGCGSSAAGLRTALEQAIADAAPEITTIEADEVERPAPSTSFVSVDQLTTTLSQNQRRISHGVV